MKITDFKSYLDYRLYVHEEWEYGAINELFEDGLIIEEPEESIDGFRTIKYRHLTEEEYNKNKQ